MSGYNDNNYGNNGHNNGYGDGDRRGEASQYYGQGHSDRQQSFSGDQGYDNQQGNRHGEGYGRQQDYSREQDHGRQQDYGREQDHGRQQDYGREQEHGRQQDYSREQEYGHQPPQYQQYASTASHSSNSGRNSHNQGSQNQYNGEGDPEGERGIMGGIAGGAAGAYGGHALGGKSGHGTSGMIAGALAGAFAGHKGEEAASDWKDERDEKKKKEHEQQQQHNQQDHQQQDQKPRGGNFAGNFTATARDIRLDAHGEYSLHAQCRRTDGSYESSTISLNKFLENDNGSFHWSSQNHGGPSTVTVQQGDTLRAIAARHNCGFEEIAQHNGIQNADMIYPGQVLRVPGGGSGSGGNFGASAKDMRLVDGGQRLEGELQRDGRWVQASIVLDERIGNVNGCLEFV
ncbi:carbohydrate-binding module family 50 protein [Dothidotthia symphoricarpi CBS 119687]|uniref:Carbohydrate-binding module family 50 protein n=1 Tax=Dothidotthia symphoricarpi CBS 119687 TaxID=1392245 RepID=A0A6A6A2U7_9PLEO|nr:carbohydrate-binding module family 50 protein [Dothidotthia symphoricarpi CBS 119687]KAF2125483.1 carbohydrate-binding module family 50 protein [Dothidotthia symphoricarpi CBS 119687]